MTSGSREAVGGSLPQATVARVIGARHERAGVGCQDEVGVLQIGDALAVAVADGHGSSARADVGARLAVKATLAALLEFARDLGERRRHLPEVQSYAEHPLRVLIVRAWRARVRAHAADDTIPLVTYGSTLIFALATADYLLVGQLGDGDLVLATGERVTRPLPADPRAFADETPSLCLPEAWQDIRVRALPVPDPDSLLLLATDGYSNSYPEDAHFDTVARDYLGLVRQGGVSGLAPHLGRFLGTVTQQGSGDDIGLALLHWPMSDAPAAHAADAETAGAEQSTAGEQYTAGSTTPPVSTPDEASVARSDKAEGDTDANPEQD